MFGDNYAIAKYHYLFTFPGITRTIIQLKTLLSLHENSKKSKKFEQIAEVAGGRVTPLWLEVNKEAGTAKVLRAFQREELDYDIAEHLIIELYSK